MANHVDVVLQRNRRIRRRKIIRFLVFALIVGVCAFIYAKRDLWFPKLEGIGSRYQNVTQNEDAIADGEFELSISGGVDYTADFINNQLFILCDKYLYIYGTDGKLIDSRQHAYSNAIMKTSESRSLIYSSNGMTFRVDTPAKILYEETLDKPIWFAVLSDEGYVAVVTESETYACRLSIYDMNGKLIYTRDCVDRLSDVSFYGNGCIFSAIGAKDGELVTTLQYITFDGDDVLWETSPFSSLCMRTCAFSDGSAFVIGDTRTAYYSGTGALLGSYDFNADLVDFDYFNEKTAILLKNEGRRQSILLLFSEKSAVPKTVSLSANAKNVIIYDDMAYVLDSGQIESFDFTGQKTGSTQVADAYERILRNGKYFYLLGYDKINRTSVG